MKTSRFSIMLIAAFLLSPILVVSQVAINSDGTSPNNSAMLDIKSTNKGVLPPRLTHAELNAIANPADGLVVYCTDCGTIGSGAMAMAMNGAWYLFNVTCLNPLSPIAVVHIPSYNQVIWKWNLVAGATGYKWNTVNNASTAIDMGTATTKTETGLTCGIAYTRFVWAYSNCGTSTPSTLIQNTLSCPVIPTVTTTPITNITTSTASSGGNIASDGGASVTARGVCWSILPNPTIAGNKTIDGSGTGLFTSSITGLAFNTLYYVRAYATNSVGTAYGNELSFTAINQPCPGIPTVVYGGKTYNTVQIGTQCWLRENLNIGSMIGGMSDQTNNSIIEKYCWNDLESNCDVYGGLYQWAEAVQYLNGASNTTSWSPPPTGNVQGICPAGWHVPSDAEWCTITIYLDSTVYCDSIHDSGSNVGSKMKETGTTHWAPPNAGATNESGFTAMPGCMRGGSANPFLYGTDTAHFWSSSQDYADHSWKRYLDYRETVSRNSNYKTNGFSVRCLKDQ
jgi:uncharacterized protein (TIGR02145 family)